MQIVLIIIAALIIPFQGICDNIESNSSVEVENLAPAGLLYDDANILNDEENMAISDILSVHNSKGPGRISILTIKELPKEVSIERYAYGFINAIPTFENEKKDRILLLISVKDRKMRIETSKDVWGALTDTECAHIIKDVIAPEFKKNRYSDGINAGLLAIINELKK